MRLPINGGTRTHWFLTHTWQPWHGPGVDERGKRNGEFGKRGKGDDEHVEHGEEDDEQVEHRGVDEPDEHVGRGWIAGTTTLLPHEQRSPMGRNTGGEMVWHTVRGCGLRRGSGRGFTTTGLQLHTSVPLLPQRHWASTYNRTYNNNNNNKYMKICTLEPRYALQTCWKTYRWQCQHSDQSQANGNLYLHFKSISCVLQIVSLTRINLWWFSIYADADQVNNWCFHSSLIIFLYWIGNNGFLMCILQCLWMNFSSRTSNCICFVCSVAKLPAGHAQIVHIFPLFWTIERVMHGGLCAICLCFSAGSVICITRRSSLFRNVGLRILRVQNQRQSSPSDFTRIHSSIW